MPFDPRKMIPTPIPGPLVRSVHTIARLSRRLRRPITVGVKVAVFNADGHLLLVRELAGTLWMLPGGGVKRNERPIDAAVREIREETGIALDADRLALVGVYSSFAEYKSDTVVMFTTTVSDPVIRVDQLEIAEARFFDPEAMPDRTAQSVHRRLVDLAAVVQQSPDW